MTSDAAASEDPGHPETATFAPKVGTRVRSALFSSVLIILVAVPGVMEPREWIAWVVLVSQLPIAVARWRIVGAAHRQPWALRVDESGVRWGPEGPLMPGGSVASIEVHQARGLRKVLPNWNRVVVVSHADADFARRAGTRPHGRGILLDEVRATPEAIVASMRPFTDAPAGLRLR
ncbi:hypothetical protein GCM10009714_09400 [Microlunatus capsulatus]